MAEQVAKVEILIRRPVAEVFDAFVRPDMITKFWLESTTGPLEPGAQVKWQFMVPGATETVTVTAFDDQRRIAFDWSDAISVNMNFEDQGTGASRLAIDIAGFKGEDAFDNFIGATEGFSIVLCDLKILLETGRSGNLVKDKAELIARA